MRKLPSEFVVAVPSFFKRIRTNTQRREKVNKTKQVKLQNQYSIKSHILLKKNMHFRPLAVATVVAAAAVEVRVVVAVGIKRQKHYSKHTFF